MLQVFVSYSHKDHRWVDRDNPHNLIPFLADSLRRDGVEIWYDHALIPGDKFQQEIESRIDQADLAILLVSQHFLNSKFIREVELPRIEARANVGDLVVIPVLVGPCNWKKLTLVGDRQMLPGGPKPLIKFVKDDAAWQEAQQEILQALEKRLEQAEMKRLQQAEKERPDQEEKKRLDQAEKEQLGQEEKERLDQEKKERLRKAEKWAPFAAVGLLAAGVLAIVIFGAQWLPLADLSRSEPTGSPMAAQGGEGAPATSGAGAPRSPLTADETAALDEQIAGYSDQIRPVPLAVAGLQSDLEAVAERLWNERTYGPESARTVASAFRLYAACLLVSPEGTSQRGIQNALPWLRRSLQLEAGFEDRAELEAAHRFFMDMAVRQPAQVEMRVMLGHQIRIALIEASQAEVDAQVEAALELITTIMQQRQSSQQ
jgi:hypothetical protein